MKINFQKQQLILIFNSFNKDTLNKEVKDLPFNENKQEMMTSTNFFGGGTNKETFPNISYKGYLNQSPRNIHTANPLFNLKEEVRDYERKLHTSHTSRGLELKKVKEIKIKMQASDPFFREKYDYNDDKFNKEKQIFIKTKKDKFDSNIFFNKEIEDVRKGKSIDKFILSNTTNKIYGINSSSRSEWSPKNSKFSLLNHTSVPFSVLNSGVKSFSKTKGEIYELSGENAANKQKAICEFIDVARVFHPNPNKEYLNALKSKNPFNQNSNICSNYLNLHRMYGSLCENPFVKKII